MPVHGRVHEIEQVAADVAAPSEPDAAALDRIVGRRVRRQPVRPSVVGRRDIEMPDAGKGRGLQTAGARRRAEKRERRAALIPGDHGRKRDVVQAEGGADVEDIRPGPPVVVGSGHDRMVVGVGKAEVDPAAPVHRDGGVAVGGAADGNDPDVPGQAVVLGDDDALAGLAPLVRHEDRPVGADLDMPVQPAALVDRINRHAGAVGQAAVVTARAEGGRDVLRAVVHRVRVAGAGR